MKKLMLILLSTIAFQKQIITSLQNSINVDQIESDLLKYLTYDQTLNTWSTLHGHAMKFSEFSQFMSAIARQKTLELEGKKIDDLRSMPFFKEIENDIEAQGLKTFEIFLTNLHLDFIPNRYDSNVNHLRDLLKNLSTQNFQLFEQIAQNLYKKLSLISESASSALKFYNEKLKPYINLIRIPEAIENNQIKNYFEKKIKAFLQFSDRYSSLVKEATLLIMEEDAIITKKVEQNVDRRDQEQRAALKNGFIPNALQQHRRLQENQLREFQEKLAQNLKSARALQSTQDRHKG